MGNGEAGGSCPKSLHEKSFHWPAKELDFSGVLNAGCTLQYLVSFSKITMPDSNTDQFTHISVFENASIVKGFIKDCLLFGFCDCFWVYRYFFLFCLGREITAILV